MTYMSQQQLKKLLQENHFTTFLIGGKKKLVMEMRAKTNQLDLLLAKFLRENIEEFVGLLANIANISLVCLLRNGRWHCCTL